MSHIKGMFFLTAAFALAGSSVVAARFVSGHAGVFTIASVSLLFALMVLLPLCWPKLRRQQGPQSAQEWFWLALQALFGIFLFRMFLLQGLNYTSSAEAGILTGITPAATAVMAFFLLKEPVHMTRWAGVGCTTAGIIMIQGSAWTGLELSAQHLLGNLLVICAALSESAFNILSRYNGLQREGSSLNGLDPLVQATCVTGLALGMCLLPAVAEQPLAALGSLDIIQWLSLAWYGWMVTALAFILWYAGIKRCEASTAAAFSGMMPFTAMLLSVTVLQEQPGWQQWAGGILVILGMLASSIKMGRSDRMKNQRAWLAGSTGLVGGHLLQRLLADQNYSEVHTIARRPSGLQHPKLSEHIVNFDDLPVVELPPADDVFCALGSTIRQAGSQEAFYKVDFTYVVNLAVRAREAGARQFLVVSSIMANPASRNFYLRVKGEMEAAVKAQGPEVVQIFRPSTIQGERKERRRGEKSGQLLMNLARPLLIGGLQKFRNIPAATIADAMLAAARNPGKGPITYESDAIALLAELGSEGE